MLTVIIINQALDKDLTKYQKRVTHQNIFIFNSITTTYFLFIFKLLISKVNFVWNVLMNCNLAKTGKSNAQLILPFKATFATRFLSKTLIKIYLNPYFT